MASHTHDVLRRAIWASLTGGYCYDPSFDLFLNTLAAWIVYACLIGTVFTILKVTNHRLHTTFDQKVIQRVEESTNNAANPLMSELPEKGENTKVASSPDLEMQPLTPVELLPADATAHGSKAETEENCETDTKISASRKNRSRSDMLEDAAHTSFFAMEDETMIAGPDNTAQLESMSLNPNIILSTDASGTERSLRQSGLRASSVGSSENKHNHRRNYRDGRYRSDRRHRGHATAFDLEVEVHQAREGNAAELSSSAIPRPGTAALSPVSADTPAFPKLAATSPDAASFDVMREKLYAVGSMEQLPDDNVIVSSSNVLLSVSSSKTPHQQACSSTTAINMAAPVTEIDYLKSTSGADLTKPAKILPAAEDDAVWKMRHASSSGMPWSRRNVQQAHRAKLAEGRSAASVTNQPSASMETILCTFVRPTNHLEEQTEALLRPPLLNEIESLGVLKSFKDADSTVADLLSSPALDVASPLHVIPIGQNDNVYRNTMTRSYAVGASKLRRTRSEVPISTLSSFIRQPNDAPVAHVCQCRVTRNSLAKRSLNDSTSSITPPATSRAPAACDICGRLVGVSAAGSLSNSLRTSYKFKSAPDLRISQQLNPSKQSGLQKPPGSGADGSSRQAAVTSSSNPPVAGSSSSHADVLGAAFVKFLQTYPNDVSIPQPADDANTVQQIITARLPLSGILARIAYDSGALRQMLNTHYAYISGEKNTLAAAGPSSLSKALPAAMPLNATSNTASTGSSMAEEPAGAVEVAGDVGSVLRVLAGSGIANDNESSQKQQLQPSLCWPYDRLAPDELKALLETREANDRRPQYPPPGFTAQQAASSSIRPPEITFAADEKVASIINSEVHLEKRLTYSPHAGDSSEDDVYVNIAPQSLLALASRNASREDPKAKFHYFTPDESASALRQSATTASTSGNNSALWTSMPGLVNTNNSSNAYPQRRFGAASDASVSNSCMPMTVSAPLSSATATTSSGRGRVVITSRVRAPVGDNISQFESARQRHATADARLESIAGETATSQQQQSVFKPLSRKRRKRRPAVAETSEVGTSAARGAEVEVVAETRIRSEADFSAVGPETAAEDAGRPPKQLEGTDELLGFNATSGGTAGGSAPLLSRQQQWSFRSHASSTRHADADYQSSDSSLSPGSSHVDKMPALLNYRAQPNPSVTRPPQPDDEQSSRSRPAPPRLPVPDDWMPTDRRTGDDSDYMLMAPISHGSAVAGALRLCRRRSSADAAFDVTTMSSHQSRNNQPSMLLSSAVRTLQSTAVPQQPPPPPPMPSIGAGFDLNDRVCDEHAVEVVRRLDNALAAVFTPVADSRRQRERLQQAAAQTAWLRERHMTAVEQMTLEVAARQRAASTFYTGLHNSRNDSSEHVYLNVPPFPSTRSHGRTRATARSAPRVAAVRGGGGRSSSTSSAVASSVAAAIVRYPFAQRLRNAERRQRQQQQQQRSTITTQYQPSSSVTRDMSTIARMIQQPRPPSPHPASESFSSAAVTVTPAHGTRIVNERMPRSLHSHGPMRRSGFGRAGAFAVSHGAVDDDEIEATFVLSNPDRRQITRRHLFGRQNETGRTLSGSNFVRSSGAAATEQPPDFTIVSGIGAPPRPPRSTPFRRGRLRDARRALFSMRHPNGQIDEDLFRLYSRTYAPSGFGGGGGGIPGQEGDEQYDYLFYHDVDSENADDDDDSSDPFAVRQAHTVHENFAYRMPSTNRYNGMLLTPPHTAVNLSGGEEDASFNASGGAFDSQYARHLRRGHRLSIAGVDVDSFDTNARHLFSAAPPSWRHLWHQSRILGDPDRRPPERQTSRSSLANAINNFEQFKLRQRPFYVFNWLPLPFKKLLSRRRRATATADTADKKFAFFKTLRKLTSTRIRFDRVALLSLMDRDKSVWMMLGALVATLLTCIFAWMILSRFEFYHDFEVVIFCVVVASCQYSLIKSVQPDAVSPTHGFNYYTVFSRAFYFCLLCGLAVGFHWLSSDSEPDAENSTLPNDFLINERFSPDNNGIVDTFGTATITADYYYRGTTNIRQNGYGVDPLTSCDRNAASFFHTFAPALDANQIFGFKFSRIRVYSHWACSLLRVILLLFPLIFTYGLLPQIPTFVMTVCQEIDVHVFGGDSPTSTISAVVNVILSTVSAACVFAVGYLAVLAMPSAVDLYELLTVQQQQQQINNGFVSSNDFAVRNLVVSAWVAMIVVVAFCLSRSTIKLRDLWRGVVQLLLTSDASGVNDPQRAANSSSSVPVPIEDIEMSALNVTQQTMTTPITRQPPLSDNLSGSDDYPTSDKGLSDVDIKDDADEEVQTALLTTSKSAPEICVPSTSAKTDSGAENMQPNNETAAQQRHSDTPRTAPVQLKSKRTSLRKKPKNRKRSLKPTSAVDELEQAERRKLASARFQSDLICSAVMFVVVFGLHASGLFSQPRELARLTCAYRQHTSNEHFASNCRLPFTADEQARFAALGSSTNVFDRLRLALLLFTCVVGVLLHYVLVEMRMENPWLSFTRPFLRSHEYNEFEPRRVARLMPFERVFVLLTFCERYGLYTLCAMAYVWNDAWILTHKLNSAVLSALLVTLAAGKFVRQAYSATHRQFVVLGLTLMFFHFDAQHLSSGAFLLDALVMAFVVDKMEELYLKFTFVLAYIAPWQITWGSAFHAFAQPFSLPHTMMLVAMAVISTALNAPLTPFLGSAIFITSYSRPQKFWEKNYHTTRWDASNLRLAQQVGETGTTSAAAGASNESSPRVAVGTAATGGAMMQDDANLNSIFYENLCNALRERLAGEIALGRWGRAGRGDFFILASENLNCMVHIIGMANGAVTFQLRGLEFRGTYCQQREVEAISEGIDSKSRCCLGIGACRALCCCFCTKCIGCSTNPFRNLPRFLTIGAGFSLRCLAWRVAAVKLIVPGYSVSDNSATAMLQMHDLRRNMLTLLTKSIIYFLTHHKSLPEWISTLFPVDGETSLLVESHHEPTHVDLDSLFTPHFDDDYDDMVGGVSRVRFVHVYEQWLKFCCEKAASTNEKPHNVLDADPTSKLTTLCYASSILVRRALAVAANRSAAHNIDMFLYGLHTLFKGDFRIQAAQDEWIFGAFDIMSDVLQPALRMSIKLHQDHFSFGDDWLTSCDALYEAIESNESSCVICHEADPAWRRNIAANFPTLVSLRHHVTDDTNHEYKFIMLTHKPLTFRLIAINRECVRGFWAGQLQELIYLRNRNPERGSIQNAKQVLRNIINSSCDQPIGYPIYVSPLITSFVETHADMRQILGGPITVNSIRTCLRSMWNGVYNYFAAGCLSGGGVLSGMANSANNSRHQRNAGAHTTSSGAVYAAGRAVNPSSAASRERMWLLPPSSSSTAVAGAELDSGATMMTTMATPSRTENIPLKTLASAASRSLSGNNTNTPSSLGETSASGSGSGVAISLLPAGKISTSSVGGGARRLFFEQQPVIATAASFVTATTSRTATSSSSSSVTKAAQNQTRGSKTKRQRSNTAALSATPFTTNDRFSNGAENVGKMIEMMPMTAASSSSRTGADSRRRSVVLNDNDGVTTSLLADNVTEIEQTADSSRTSKNAALDENVGERSALSASNGATNRNEYLQPELD